MWYPKRSPKLVTALFSEAVWQLDATNKKEIALSFDDGPHPQSTPRLLDLLDRCEVKATMFLIGENALKYPHLYQLILDKGHSVGAHTMTHLDGWKSNKEDYLTEVCESLSLLSTRLFRPPYGRLTLGQYREVCQFSDVIMWSLITGDFDQHISSHRLTLILNELSRDNDIILLHDTPLAVDKYSMGLAQYIEKRKSEGFSFVKL